MPFEDVFSNVLLMFLCYAYLLAIIVVSGKMDKTLQVSRKSAISSMDGQKSGVVGRRCGLILKSLR